ncbi:MAG: GIY-YIG nuclease family protein [Candidatus Heimdallarchaeota archaeon]
MFYLYILYSKSHDRYYVGQTDNLEKRLERHNSGMVSSTKSFVTWKLVYSENYATRSEAVKREREIKRKKSRGYIERLLNRQSPDRGRD